MDIAANIHDLVGAVFTTHKEKSTFMAGIRLNQSWVQVRLSSKEATTTAKRSRNIGAFYWLK